MTAVAFDTWTRIADPSAGMVMPRSTRPPAVRVIDSSDTSVGPLTSYPSTASTRYGPAAHTSIGPLSVLITRTRTERPGGAGTR